MFSQVKTAATAAIIGFSITPASAAIVDVFMTASLTEMTRTGIFKEGEVDFSDYDEGVDREVSDEVRNLFSDARIGDEVLLQWEFDTGLSNDVKSTLIINGTSWSVENDGYNNGGVFFPFPTPDGGNTDEFRIGYEAIQNEWRIGGDSSITKHFATINSRPESYIFEQGPLNEFNMSGDNLGSGSLEMDSIVDGFSSNDPFGWSSIRSGLWIDYQITSIKTSLRDTTVAPVPLPAGALLLASGLIGFGLLRRRKA